MSHFSVTVVCKDPAEVEQILAPYSESITVEPYWEPHYKADEIKTMAQYAEYVREAYVPGGALGPERWTAARLEHPELPERAEDATQEQLIAFWTEEDGSDLREGPDGLEQRTTYNPRSKWDYWRVGGRWSGYWPVKPEFYGADELVLPKHHWEFEHEPEHAPRKDGTRADGAMKYMIDFSALEVETMARVNKQIADAGRIVGDRPFPDFPVDIRGDLSELSTERARAEREAMQAWWKEPVVAELTDWDKGPFGGMPSAFDVRDAVLDPDRFRERELLAAIPTYALVTAEGWMEPGKMGWFAMSDATEDDRTVYRRRYREVIEQLPDDWWLIVVDCHI